MTYFSAISRLPRGIRGVATSPTPPYCCSPPHPCLFASKHKAEAIDGQLATEIARRKVEPPTPNQSDETLTGQTRDAANGATSRLRGQIAETLADAPARLPERIGQYHIKRVIASGGMGAVYEAVQKRPR